MVYLKKKIKAILISLGVRCCIFLTMEYNRKSLNLYSDFPLVMRGKIRNWKILNYNENDWCNEFGDRTLKFRQGFKNFRKGPYWENLCGTKEITLQNFFELSSENQESWLYFDYKYMKDVFPESSKLLNNLKWDDLNLFDSTGLESTLWIGNEGAHTPCHMDTYGCNFVAQIFGRKMWILIPPEEADCLNCVRVPYEESSIYSLYNFYTPNNELLKIKKAYKIILTPGDILFVPRHWWHYVENLEVAISVNMWVPMDIDHESRLEESLIRHYVSNICQNLRKEDAKKLLNPNEYDLLEEPCLFKTVEVCVQNCQEFRKKNCCASTEENEGKSRLSEGISEINMFDIKSYIAEKSKSHGYDPTVSENFNHSHNHNYNDGVTIAARLINAFCHPINVSLIKETLLKEFNTAN